MVDCFIIQLMGESTNSELPDFGGYEIPEPAQPEPEPEPEPDNSGCHCQEQHYATDEDIMDLFDDDI